MEMMIFGSEVFDYDINPPEVIRQKIPSKLKLHTVPEEMLEEIDRVTYEVIRHRIWAITDEMGETMKRMTGSIVVAECNDFDVAIMDEIGDGVMVGLYNTELGAAQDMAVKWTLENRSESPGIEDGDMFLTNDPWVGGGLHQSDACLFAPLFWKGELFCWTSACCHELDLGGVVPGSWTPVGDSVFWESMPLPPVKIVRGGVLQKDVEDVHLRRTRFPMLIALDVRAKMGAINIAHDRFRALIRKYGSKTVKAVMKLMLNEAEEKLRAKLQGLPDGTWTTAVYQEQAKQGDRGLYKIALKMTKKDDRLVFDFTGTDKQVEGVLNCTFAGVRGGVLGGVLPNLCGDIPWAPGGLFRCIDIISEKGTINNALFPAGIAKAPISSAWASGLAAMECLSKMLNTTPPQRKSVWASCAGTWQMLVFAGLDQRSAQPMPFVYGNLDPMAGGQGARTDMDGVDTGGLHLIPMGLIADVEMQEYAYPILFLWRREEMNSGGPGKFRGGLSPSDCLIGYGSDLPMQNITSGAGKGMSMNVGLSGGYPGNTAIDIALRETNIREMFKQGVMPSSLDDIKCQAKQVLQAEEISMFGVNDVYYFNWHGGGGYMDPLLREPQNVLHDIREEKISPEVARSIYGVVVDNHSFKIDEEETKKVRAQILETRAAKAKKPELPAQGSGHTIALSPEAEVTAVDENVVIVGVNGQKVLKCAHCDQVICRSDENYPDHLLFYGGQVTEAGPQIYPNPGHYVDAKIGFRQYCCPGCHVAFITQIVPVG